MSTLLIQYLAELKEHNKPIIASQLANLSDLSPEEIRIFEEEWPHIEVSRRRKIIDLLRDIVVDNLELDFDNVFRSCLTDSDKEVRVEAIEGLWECEDRSLIPILLNTLNQDNDDSVRAAAAGALGRFAFLAELGELNENDQQHIENILRDTFNNKNEPLEIRCKALEAISPLSNLFVEEMIRRGYQSEVDELKASAIYAMGRNCNPGWLPILLKELNNPSKLFKCEAIRACAELESEEAVQRIIQFLSDDNSEIQLTAIEALGHIGGYHAKKALQLCMDNEADEIQQAAEDALSEIEFWDDPAHL